MLITKTPFRISFCGGGSDIKDFYKENGGCVLSATINKYMYISIHPYFEAEYISLKYSQNELVKHYDEIKHSIMRCALKEFNIKGVEIVSTADVPSGTGLGSSSAFTVGLLHVLNCYKGKYVSKERVAQEACRIEIEELRSPIGKQDQYAAAYGGLNFIRFHQNDHVTVEPIIMKTDTLKRLQDNLIMFYTGLTHNTNMILSEQKQNILYSNKVQNLRKLCRLTNEMKASLERDDLSSFGQIMNEGWYCKKEMASGITNSFIDEAYEVGMKSGAIGGKLLGAGGGGFLLFYCEKNNQEYLESAIKLRKLEFSFEYDGTTIIYTGNKYWK